MDWADWAEYMTGRIKADGADRADGRADGADYGILDGADWGGYGVRGRLADWRMGWTPSYWTGRTGRNTGLGGLVD